MGGAGNGARFGLVTTLAGLLAVLTLLVDRIGAPPRLVLLLAPVLGLAALVFIGISFRTMKISRFYVTDRGMPAAYAGLGLGGIGFAIWFALQPSAADTSGMWVVALAMLAGLALAGLLTGPLLRKSGAFSVAGFLGFRFPGVLFRLLVLVPSALVAILAGLAGLQAAGHALAVATSLGPIASVTLSGLALVLLTVPGGLGGAAWVTIAASGCILGALLVGIGLGGLQQMDLPLPLGGDGALLASMLGHVGDFAGWGSPAARNPLPATVIVLGLASFPPLLGLAIGSPRAALAGRAGLVGLCWGMMLVLAAVSTMALTLHSLDQNVLGLKPDQLPATAYFASSKGEMLICGKAVATPAAARAACAGAKDFANVVQAANLWPSPLALLSGLGSVRNPPLALSSLILAGQVFLQLASAAMCLHLLAAAIAHEGFYRLRDTAALTSRRLAIARAVMLLATAGGVAACLMYTLDGRWLVIGALAISAAFVTPLLALALWPLATTRDAVLALLAAGGVAVWQAAAWATGGADLGSAVEWVAGGGLSAGLAASLVHRRSSRPWAFFRALFARPTQMMPADKGA